MAFCTGCGTAVSDDVRFCTGCGKSMSAELTPAPEMETEQAPVPPEPVAPPTPQPEYRQAYQPAQQPAYQHAPQTPPPSYTSPPAQPPVYGEDDRPARGSKYAVMGTGAYFGTMILFCIPVIGWISCIIMAFAVQNRNLRNFARAMMIFLIIGAVMSVVAYFSFRWIAGEIMKYMNETANGAFGEFRSFADIFKIYGIAG